MVGLLALSLGSVVIMAALGPPSVLFIVGVSLAFALATILLALRAPEKTIARASVVVLTLAIACFAATMAQEFLLGGTPLNGKITELGHFVGSHGHYRAVSETVYRWSLLFDIGVIVLWPTMLGLVAVSNRRNPTRAQRSTL